MKRWPTRWSVFGDPVPAVTSSMRAAILTRDGERCGYCHTDTGPFHIDHIVPVRVNGPTAPDNLTVACVDCNQRKSGDLSPFWMRLLARSGAEVPARRAVFLLEHYFYGG